MKKLISTLFVVSLLVIASFLAGVRYGVRVEETNNYLDFIMDIQRELQKAAESTKEDFVSLKLVKLPECFLEFVLPEKTVYKKENTHKFLYKKDLLAEIKCESSPLKESNEVEEKELLFAEKKIRASKQNGFFKFVIKHPKRNLWYEFRLNKKIFLLVSKTLKFL